MPINWQDGSAGGTPLSAANLNRLAVVADIGTAGTPTGDAVKAAAAAQVTDTAVAAQVTAGANTKAALRAAFVAHDSQVIDLCAAPYNASPGADITTALQTAVNTLAASGQSGKIVFTKVGTYLLSGPLQTGSYTGSAGNGDRQGGGRTHTWNAQVVFPAVPFDGVAAPAITIEGAVDPSLGWKFTGDAQGVQIVSTITSGKMFEAASGYDGWGTTWTGIMPIFRNLILRLPDNPTAGAIDVQHALRARFERVAVLTSTAWVVPSSGNISTAVAIALPASLENGDVSIRDVNVRGFPSAFRISEHALFDNIQIVGCKVAFICGAGGHTNYLGNVDIEEVESVFYLEPSIHVALSVYGYIDEEQNGLWPTMNLLEDPGDTGLISGVIDVSIGVEGGLGLKKTSGAQNVPSQLEVRNPNHGQVSGWSIIHPSDTFARNSGNGAAGAAQGAPGYSWPSMHPWRASDGDFTIPASVPQTSGKSVMRQTSGYGSTALVPAKNGRSGGVQRSIEATFHTATSGIMSFGLIASRRFNVNSCIFAAVFNGRLQLGVGSMTTQGLPLSVTGVAAPGDAVTLRLDVYYANRLPVLARAYINGALKLTRAITAAEATGNLAPADIGPYLEDGVFFSDTDTGTGVSDFVVRDLPAQLATLSSGTATLVAGTKAVADPGITASSSVRLNRQAAGGTLGQLSVALTAGTGFTINSSSGTDTSSVYYEVASY